MQKASRHPAARHCCLHARAPSCSSNPAAASLCSPHSPYRPLWKEIWRRWQRQTAAARGWRLGSCWRARRRRCRSTRRSGGRQRCCGRRASQVGGRGIAGLLIITVCREASVHGLRPAVHFSGVQLLLRSSPAPPHRSPAPAAPGLCSVPQAPCCTRWPLLARRGRGAQTKRRPRWHAWASSESGAAAAAADDGGAAARLPLLPHRLAAVVSLRCRWLALGHQASTMLPCHPLPRPLPRSQACAGGRSAGGRGRGQRSQAAAAGAGGSCRQVCRDRGCGRQRRAGGGAAAASAGVPSRAHGAGPAGHSKHAGGHAARATRRAAPPLCC